MTLHPRMAREDAVPHPETGKLYSKYGILNTLIYVPPLLVEKITRGVLDFLLITESPVNTGLFVRRLFNEEKSSYCPLGEARGL